MSGAAITTRAIFYVFHTWLHSSTHRMIYLSICCSMYPSEWYVGNCFHYINRLSVTNNVLEVAYEAELRGCRSSSGKAFCRGRKTTPFDFSPI